MNKKIKRLYKVLEIAKVFAVGKEKLLAKKLDKELYDFFLVVVLGNLEECVQLIYLDILEKKILKVLVKTYHKGNKLVKKTIKKRLRNLMEV